MQQCKQVVFIEQPREGQPARMIVDGQTATTSPVTLIQTHVDYPGMIWITTYSGSRYAGFLQTVGKTTYGMPAALPAVTQNNRSVPQQNRKGPRPSVVAALVILTVCGLIAMGSTPGKVNNEASDSASAESNNEDESCDAFYMSQQFARKGLKCPSTAKFPSYYDQPSDEIVVNKVADKTYEVGSVVDSQNGFGAMIRTKYYCKLTKVDDDNWICVDLKFDE